MEAFKNLNLIVHNTKINKKVYIKKFIFVLCVSFINFPSYVIRKDRLHLLLDGYI